MYLHFCQGGIGSRVPHHDDGGVRCVVLSSRAPEDREGGSVFGFVFHSGKVFCHRSHMRRRGGGLCT